MHILTKILVVLVALLACAIAPLAAVSSTNQFVFKQKAEDATATLNDQVFADIGISQEHAAALVAAIDTLRHRAGDF